MKKPSKIIFYIFAMRRLHKSIALAILIFLLYNKGIVPNSFSSNTLSGLRKLRGLYPHFLKVNYFLMRRSENNLQQTSKASTAVTSISRNEINPILFLQDLFANGNAKLFTISANARYCYVRFKTPDNKFYHARETSIAAACTSIITKLKL